MCASLRASAQNTTSYQLLPDSSNFVTASLIVVSPGDNIYSNLGHCAIHLKCPVHNLDFYYSFGTFAATRADIFSFFAGNLKAQYLAIDAKKFMAEYVNEGREVKEVELNLTLHEQQRLWQLLDEELANTDKYKFNYLKTNCTSMSLKAIEWSLIDEQLEFGQLPEPLTWINGDCANHHTRNLPWLTFIDNTLMGIAAYDYYDTEERLCPEIIISVLENARIVPNDGSKSRPVFKGKPVTILPLKKHITRSPITPKVVFGSLLALVVIITLLEWLLKWRKVAMITDCTLLVAQTIIGCLLLYMSTVTCLFGLHWNWYLIVYNPIPLILWVVLRKKPWFYKVYDIYFVILMAFVACTPLNAQLDIEHQLITLALAVRCESKYMWFKKQKNEKNK